jgi:HD-GYP domain-containing protein (c-di-GMP phosphodiesterase class II)
MPNTVDQREASSAVLAPSAKQFAQVAAATLLVAGLPVAVVWWLRGSGAVSSAAPGALIGMGLSLALSRVACLVWESLPGSDDLLFSELMIWGYLNRWLTQRRLASARGLLGALGETRLSIDGRSPKDPVELLERLVARMETRDPYLHGHSRRVARHSWMIARRMGLPRAQAARIRTAAALHDVGKINTPRAILHKAGGLSAAEFEVIKRHPGDGARMVAVLRDAELTAIVRHHHERLDGSGYPSGLSGAEIPLGARIIAVADSFDAITSTRPYRSARTHKQAIAILKEESGIKLDRDAVRAFCSHYAGRHPLALWSSVAGLPGRVVSWLGESAAGVASVAKVVAVTALIGGAAVTSATLGLPAAKHLPAAAYPATAAGPQSPLVNLTPVRAVLASGPTGKPLRRRLERFGRGALAPPAHRGSPTAQTVAARVAGAELSPQSTGTARSSGQDRGLGKGSTGAAPSPGKPEQAPGRGKPEEAPRKPEAPGGGTPQGTPGTGTPEGTPGTGAPEGTPGTGTPEETPGRGKHEETPGKGKHEGAPGTGKPDDEEAPGKPKPEEGRERDKSETTAARG